MTICQDPAGRIFHWDQRAGVSGDARLLTFTWTYDRDTTSYLNIQRRISSDEGKTWTSPEDLGFSDQPSHPAIPPDGRVAVVWVDRFKTHSIRARMAKNVTAPLLSDTKVVLYEFQPKGQKKSSIANTGEMLLEMGLWTFGLPFAEALPDGEVIVVYYSGSQACTDIHWSWLSLQNLDDG